MLSTFTRRCLTVYVTDQTIDPAISVFFIKAGDCYERYRKVFEKDDTRPYTERKAKADSERDETFIAFRYYF